MLDLFLSQHAEVATKLRIIDMLGPSSIPPVVVSKSLNTDLKCRIQEVFMTMHQDPDAARGLHAGLIERFVLVTDDDYRDIRTMYARVQAAQFPFLLQP
jgi:phosphonate transport system substrate-binding protein